MLDHNVNVLSRSGPAAAVVGVHVLIAYILTVSMGVIDMPKFATPIAAIFIPENKPVVPEPEIPMVAPQVTDLMRLADPTMPQIEIDEPVVPPTEVPMPPSQNSIAAVTAPEPASSGPASGTPAQQLKISKHVEPAYPAQARRAGEAGSVRLRILVDERGMPRDIQIVQGSGFTRLDQAAIDAVRRWRFVAATNGSQAIAAWTQVAITFRLTG